MIQWRIYCIMIDLFISFLRSFSSKNADVIILRMRIREGRRRRIIIISKLSSKRVDYVEFGPLIRKWNNAFSEGLMKQKWTSSCITKGRFFAIFRILNRRNQEKLKRRDQSDMERSKKRQMSEWIKIRNVKEYVTLGKKFTSSTPMRHCFNENGERWNEKQ